MKTRVLMSLTLPLLVTLCSLAGEPQADGPALPAKEKFHLFLLAGQSNMAGRGRVTEEDTAVHPRVFALSKDNKWVPAKDPIHFDKSGAGVGLGRTFGITLADRDSSIAVGLIPCAVGGSPVSSWEPGEYYRPTRSHPYDDAVKRTKIAVQRGTLKAILWHQGESDSKPELAGVYEKKLHALVARFRKEFGVPELPFVVGQLGQFPERPWDDARSLVNSAHESLPQKVKNAVFVASKGLTHKGDKVHFDAKSIREFGKRYAEAYVCLLEKTGEKDKPAKKPKKLVLFDGKTLDGWKKVKFGAEGEVKVENGAITLSRGTSLTGITSTRKDLPTINYELSFEAMRLDGFDFFAAVTFPVGKTHVSFLNGGWGGSVTGISSIDGYDASENEFSVYREYKNKKWYKFRLRITGERVQCWIDGKMDIDMNYKGRRLGTRIEADLSKPLGFSSWETGGAVRKIEIRMLTPAEVAATNKPDK